MSSQVNTSKVEDVRHLRFDSVDAVLADVDRVIQASEEGRLRVVGNWTPGQILAHIAAWIEYGYEGFPMQPPPWFVRWILRWRLPKYLRDGMPRGVRIPGVAEGTFGMDDQPIQQAADRLKRAFQRLKDGEPATYHSPAFGVMSHEDRIRLNLRHAELHLGFLVY
jgi:hypothetical protein